MGIKEKWQNPWIRIPCLIVGTGAIMLGMVYVDVWMRAKEAYQEGEKYSTWYAHPDIKRVALQVQFDKEKAEIESRLKRGKIKPDESELLQEEAQYEFTRQMEENDIKYALVWYKTVTEMFNPPRSRWVIAAEEKIPGCKARLWDDFVKIGVYTNDQAGREKFEMDW